MNNTEKIFQKYKQISSTRNILLQVFKHSSIITKTLWLISSTAVLSYCVALFFIPDDSILNIFLTPLILLIFCFTLNFAHDSALKNIGINKKIFFFRTQGWVQFKYVLWVNEIKKMKLYNQKNINHALDELKIELNDNKDVSFLQIPFHSLIVSVLLTVGWKLIDIKVPNLKQLESLFEFCLLFTFVYYFLHCISNINKTTLSDFYTILNKAKIRLGQEESEGLKDVNHKISCCVSE